MGEKSGQKRKNNHGARQSTDKAKKIRYWKSAASTIHPGVAGIFATCGRHYEKQCTQELLDLFNEEAEKQYDFSKEVIEESSDDNENDDIEASINKELESLQKSKARKLFTPVNIDCECVLFFRTKKPIDPPDFVHKICENALRSGTKTTRHTLRLSPVSLTASATEEDLKNLAEKVLAPHFHAQNQPTYKFAIRTTIRNHTTLNRDQIIQLLASAVGPPHKVDLKDYDRLVHVECFKNIVGISVVRDFETLKRFNLQQIFESKANQIENE
ncbi:hypothetical protein POJ06DRAFT_98580 [Lipomyces tetrasporus]|uniref:THUMP domain-containing protein n=1 Tax=Lipomyces tetrasporus TaxID=54092 RepID=A0AAD7QUC7_9ASCO|nr:uncharacterized protein POJ06DRAFT_98580 [Lipomyces tetrasporus]KAJ8101549.1 hypothetical protein POJ06DRAFT_98580 [Lipomyces tetrasporus]